MAVLVLFSFKYYTTEHTFLSMFIVRFLGVRSEFDLF